MFRILVVLFFSPILILFLDSNLNEINKINSSSSIKPSPTKTPYKNSPPKITEFNLDKQEVILPCAPGIKSPDYCLGDMMVNIFTNATDAENDAVIYKYTVSGGKIIGNGAKVQWDLKYVRPGAYEIKAEVDDGCGFCGEPQIRTIEVRECNSCCGLCECPTILIESSNSNAKQGELINITAKVIGGDQDEIKYNWIVDEATIIEGQRTSNIKVLLPNSEKTVTATVEIEGLCEDCPATESYTINIVK